jgi:hypothetical protein
MPVDERSRHSLYLRLEEILGPQDATTLMEHLPPVGWADVATKRDLDHLAERLTAQFRGELLAQTRTIILSMIGLFLTAAGIVAEAARAL